MDIFEAARNNRLQELAEALKIIHPDQTDNNGNSALTIACYYNHLEAAGLLLQSKANPNFKDRMGNTPLMGACFKGYYNISALLLNSGAVIEEQNGNLATALIFAATFGKNDIVELLLDRGANPLTKDRFGKNAVDYARVQENEECYELLAASANLRLHKMK